MLDIKFIREYPEKVKEGLRKKQTIIDLDQLLEVDKEHRKLLQQVESLRAEMNILSDQIAQAKTQKQEAIVAKLLQQAEDVKEKLRKFEQDEREKKEALENLLRFVPNLPLADVPEGKDETENVVLYEKGEKPQFPFKPKDYLTLAENLDLIDMERAAKVSGSRFGYLKNEAALLEFALIGFTFDQLTKKGFAPIVPPVLIKEDSMQAMGYLERGKPEIYHLEKDNLYLVGTSEQAVGPMHKDEIFQEVELPRRYVAFSSCFRREAGSYGKDTQGIFRVHQFDKVEMLSFCHPDESQNEHKLFLTIQEELMQALKIPYRVVQICTGDLGDPAAAKYDIEAWLPGQNDGHGEYRETHSTSNTTDFQARRLNIRFKPGTRNPEPGTRFVHMINGTAFAIGRTLIAIFENYQQEDGSIQIPEALRSYCAFNEIKK